MPIKILTYNVDFRGKNLGYTGRLKAFIEGIGKLKPEVICLQEFGNTAVPAIQHLQSLGYLIRPGDRDVCTCFRSDVNVHYSKNVKFAYNLSGICTFSKAGMIGKGFSYHRFTVKGFREGLPVLLANTHLEPHEKNELVRKRQFSTMVHYLNTDGTKYQIIAGDLNEPKAQALGERSGFVCDGKAFVTHHHGDNLRRKNGRAAARKDWIMVKGLDLDNSSVHTIRMIDALEVDISDHSAVIGTVW